MITFDMLPDDVLLEIFDLDLDEDMYNYIESFEEVRWVRLVHVCRRWRSVVFQSPRRLNLRLLCTPTTPAKDSLDIWPPLPLIIRDIGDFSDKPSMDNIIAALEHSDRVCEIDLNNISSEHLGYLTNSAAMQKPFPELTYLDFHMFGDGPGRRLPDSFLGGTAPRLRSLSLCNVPFPGLPKLLLSATRLVFLQLSASFYIRPEVLATSLSALTSLEKLYLYFPPRSHCGGALERWHPRPRPPPPPLTRPILPNLTEIRCKRSREYADVILARIDAPRLEEIDG
jgi:F-box-like